MDAETDLYPSDACAEWRTEFNSLLISIRPPSFLELLNRLPLHSQFLSLAIAKQSRHLQSPCRPRQESTTWNNNPLPKPSSACTHLEREHHSVW
jgi:hypothetical protein